MAIGALGLGSLLASLSASAATTSLTGAAAGAAGAAAGGSLLGSLGKFGASSILPSLLNSSFSFGGDDFRMTLGDPRSRMIQQMMSGMGGGGGMNPSVITRTGQKEDPFAMLGRLLAPQFQFRMGR